MRLVAAIAVGLLATGCDKGKKDEGAAASASVVSATVAPSASAVAKAAPCTVDAAVTVDTGVRGDAGLTLVALPDGRLALGYATGAGAPKVAIIDAAGKASFAEVEDKHL